MFAIDTVNARKQVLFALGVQTVVKFTRANPPIPLLPKSQNTANRIPVWLHEVSLCLGSGGSAVLFFVVQVYCLATSDTRGLVVLATLLYERNIKRDLKGNQRSGVTVVFDCV